MSNEDPRVTSSAMTPLPAPLWVEGEKVNPGVFASGTYIEGVAVAIRAETTADDEGEYITHNFVVMTTDGTVEEMDTESVAMVRPYSGDVYAPYLAGLADEMRAPATAISNETAQAVYAALPTNDEDGISVWEVSDATGTPVHEVFAVLRADARIVCREYPTDKSARYNYGVYRKEAI